MRLLIVVFFLLLIPLSAESQSVNVSPGSVVALGQISATPEISAEYKFVTAVFIPFRRGSYRREYIGVFVSPTLSMEGFSVTPMAGLFNKPLFNKYGSTVNFGVKVSRKITGEVRIYFRHLSNAGLAANPGLDNIGISVSI